MDLELKKKWLWRYRDAMFKAESLWRQAQEWQNVIYTPSCKVLDGMPKSPGFSNNSCNKVLKHLELIEEANEATVNANKLRNEISETIDTLEDSLGRKILTLRYIEGLEWRDIRNIIHYSKTHTTKLHQEALTNLKIEEVGP